MSAVRAVYVVLSHRDWAQVRRLATAILRSTPNARVLIAHDARTDLFPADAGDERIEILVHGLASDWGSWEIVEATLHAFAFARERWNPQLMVLISGQDYPVRNLQQWEQEALEAPSWIGDAHPLQYRSFWGRRRGQGDDRYTRYAYRWYRAPLAGRGFPLPGRRFRERVRSAVALRLEPVFSIRYVTRGRGRYYGLRRLPPPFTGTLPCWFGSQWIGLRRAEIDTLLDHDLAPGSPLRRLYRRSIIPDESALVTPLAWRAAPSVLPPVTKVEWRDSIDGVTTWTIDDLPALRASGSPFCRKVDATRSGMLMDALDEIIVQ